MAGEQDEASKTEEPTAKRLEEARKRGQVAISREVNSWFVLLAATIALGGLGPGLATQGKAMIEAFVGGAHLMRIEHSSFQAMAIDLCAAVALAARRGYATLFAVSYSDDLFLHCGFDRVPLSTYPEKIARYQQVDRTEIEVGEKHCFARALR